MNNQETKLLTAPSPILNSLSRQMVTLQCFTVSFLLQAQELDLPDMTSPPFWPAT